MLNTINTLQAHIRNSSNHKQSINIERETSQVENVGFEGGLPLFD